MIAKPIEKKRELFELNHLDLALKAVFDEKRGIRFYECSNGVKGEIIIKPDDFGGATMKCRAWPVWSNIAKTMTIECADRDDFELAFARARQRTIEKMRELSKSKIKIK